MDLNTPTLNEAGNQGEYVIDPKGADAPLLPAGLAEKILEADAIILLSTPPAGGLRMEAVAFGEFRPGTVATHAYVSAHEQEFGNVMARVMGKPTDAQRYQALREFACLAGTDPARFETINSMLQKFEEANMGDDPAENIAEDHDKMAEFLMHALLETAPLVVEQRQPDAH